MSGLQLFAGTLVVALCWIPQQVASYGGELEIDCNTTLRNVSSDVTNMTFLCPASCNTAVDYYGDENDNMTSSGTVERVGNGFYSEYSHVCVAAEAAGVLQNSREVSVIILPSSSSFNQSHTSGPIRTFLLKNSDCYVNRGEHFFALADFTRGGDECMQGTCSNVDGSRDRPWCDVFGANPNEWRYCDVAPSCDDIHVINLEDHAQIDSSVTPGTVRNMEQHKTWIIGAKDGSKVEFKIVEATHDKTENCDSATEYIALYHDFTSEYNNVIKVCDPEYRETVTSSNNLLYVEFRADGISKHFKAEIRAISNEVDCGGEYINVAFGNLSTPNYPEVYPNLVTCTWRIRGSNTSVVRIRLQQFELQEPKTGENCRKSDYVEIIDGGDTLVDLCGTLQTQVITSSTNDVTVKFTSDSTGQYPGFFASFETIEKTPCFFEFFGERGNFETPGFPESFSHHAARFMEPNETEVICTWRISFEPGNHITVNFTNITCAKSSHVRIYDGEHSTDNLLAVLCGTVANMTSLENNISISSSREDILVVMTSPAESNEDLSFRFDSTAILSPKPDTTLAASTTREASTAVMTSASTTSNPFRSTMTSSSKTASPVTTITAQTTAQSQSTAATSPLNDRSTTPMATTKNMAATAGAQRTREATTQNGKSGSLNVTHTVISVAGAFFGVVLVVVTAILILRIKARRSKRSPQHGNEDLSRTEDFELASLNAEDTV